MKCDWCGNEFDKTSNHQRFCSKKCQRAYARNKLKKAKTDERICPVCGRAFLTYEESNKVCCTNECYTQYHREKMRDYSRRRQKPKIKGGCERIDKCYYGVGGICQYLLITGRTRNCDIDGCTKFKDKVPTEMRELRSIYNRRSFVLLSKVQKNGETER